jgi:hypothetical protein
MGPLREGVAVSVVESVARVACGAEKEVAAARKCSGLFQFIPYRLHVPDAILPVLGTTSSPVIALVSLFQYDEPIVEK